MKIPSKLTIKGKVWSIAYKWRLHDKKLGACDALVDFESNTIYLDRSLAKEDKFQALLHEIFHIAIQEFHLRETGGIADDFAEEIICSGIPSILTELFTIKFRDNK